MQNKTKKLLHIKVSLSKACLFPNDLFFKSDFSLGEKSLGSDFFFSFQNKESQKPRLQSFIKGRTGNSHPAMTVLCQHEAAPVPNETEPKRHRSLRK